MVQNGAASERETFALTCAVLRGGTSRGLFFPASELPYERPVIEQILLNAFGTPDRRQINGLGGTTSVTSKAAIIGPPSRPDADIDYTFAQVGVDRAVVDWGGNCGNISSAVGPYAINHGLVPIDGNPTVVRIHNTNTGKLILAHVPIAGDRAAELGDCVIPGVPGSGARIEVEFVEPAGSVTGKLLPTGQARDTVEVADGRSFAVSVVDAANPVVFVLAAELGCTGTENPNEIRDDPMLMATLEEIRSVVAGWLGFVDDPRFATTLSPGIPKVGFVSPPREYQTTTGVTVEAGQVDLVGRLMTMQTPHQSYMAAGAICTAAAAVTPGTIVHEVVGEARPEDVTAVGRVIRIGHPYGIMRTAAALEGPSSMPTLRSGTIERTAREIMTGVLHIPTALLTAR